MLFFSSGKLILIQEGSSVNSNWKKGDLGSVWFIDHVTSNLGVFMIEKKNQSYDILVIYVPDSVYLVTHKNISQKDTACYKK